MYQYNPSHESIPWSGGKAPCKKFVWSQIASNSSATADACFCLKKGGEKRGKRGGKEGERAMFN